MIIGIDIGGTNTDLVLVDEDKKIIRAVKEPTTASIEEGVTAGILKLLPDDGCNITSVRIGTTHATNAIVQEKGLLRVGVLRIAGQNPDIAPGATWPVELRKKVIVGCETIAGGYECTGVPITPFCPQHALSAIAKLKDMGAQALSIIGVFAPMKADQERMVQEICQDLFYDLPLSISSDIGGLSFLERENATILNSALKQVIRTGFQKLETALKRLGISAPLSMIHNDGSIMDMREALEFPIFTVACGQTNSFRGAATLASMQKGAVIDIGGTSSDIGLVIDGFAKRSTKAVCLGGVKLQLPMPDTLSLALGGGSIVKEGKVGPESVARLLRTKASCFGGDTVTLTDVALRLGIMEIEEARTHGIPLTAEDAQGIMQQVDAALQRAFSRIAAKHPDIPIIAVGGGAPLLFGTKIDCHIPAHFDVANAYGAALAEVSARADAVVSLSDKEKIFAEMKTAAIQQAIERGAKKESVRIVHMEVIPYGYSQDALARVIVTASG